MTKLRSENWFNDRARPDMTGIYVERILNYGLTREELQTGRPIIGIAQTGSDLSPCNRGHLALAERTKAGIRDAGGIPLEFPVHPIQESIRRPTAALDRNLAYLGLVEVLHGYPLDGVVLTTGCDKTTPACLMAACTTDLPSIVLSMGPMLDSYYQGERVGAGATIWEAHRQYACGRLDYEGVMEMSCASSPSIGHCNTMGTALSMNSLAEALGMSLPGCGAIPAAYRERGQIAYATGRRIVDMVREDLTPSKILTREAFENAILVNTAIGGSTNCPPHITAIARHIGVELSIDDWQSIGHEIPLLLNLQPAGEYLGEHYFRAGGVPAIAHELLTAGKLRGSALTVNGRAIGENVKETVSTDRRVIRSYDEPLLENAGFLVMRGNLFDAALMKTSVISPSFRERYLSTPGSENRFEGRAIVFEGPEDYGARIEDPALNIDDSCLLVIRGCGPVAFPGSAEVVNMRPPAALLEEGVRSLPTIGDGRQSGTSDSPSILNASPESAAGGGLGLLETGDRIVVDLNTQRVDVLLSANELAQRREKYTAPELTNDTPWQEIHRSTVGQLATGACMELATKYRAVREKQPRHGH